MEATLRSELAVGKEDLDTSQVNANSEYWSALRIDFINPAFVTGGIMVQDFESYLADLAINPDHTPQLHTQLKLYTITPKSSSAGRLC